MKTVC